MSKIRKTSMNKYNISNNEYMMLYYFCLQYSEWRKELQHIKDSVKSADPSGSQKTNNISDTTGKLAIRRAELEEKCKLIEQTAIEADADLYQYILKGVTDENVTYRHLQVAYGIPCSRNTYYDRRKLFYYLLSKKI